MRCCPVAQLLYICRNNENELHVCAFVVKLVCVHTCTLTWRTAHFIETLAAFLQDLNP